MKKNDLSSKIISNTLENKNKEKNQKTKAENTIKIKTNATEFKIETAKKNSSKKNNSVQKIEKSAEIDENQDLNEISENNIGNAPKTKIISDAEITADINVAKPQLGSNEDISAQNFSLGKNIGNHKVPSTRAELKGELAKKLQTLKVLSNQNNKIARIKVDVPEVRHSQIKKKSDRLIVSFNDIFYSSNLLSKINLYIFAHRKAIIILFSIFIILFTISFGVGFGYFKKYKGFPTGGDFSLLPGYLANQPTYDPANDAVFASGGNAPSLANVFQWGQINYNAPLENFNGQIYYMGNSTSKNARDGLDVKEQRWGAVNRDNLLYKYSKFDGPTLRFGNDINNLNNKDFWAKYFTHKYYVTKTKKSVYPGDMQMLHDALSNKLLKINTPIITYDDRFKINEKKQSAGHINKMTNLLYTVLKQGTIVNNSIGLPVSITGGGADGNAYLRDPYITWVDLANQDKYHSHSKLSVKKHPEIANDFFTTYIKNAFKVHNSLITDDSRLGPANVKNFPLFCILDQNSYYYPSLGSNVLARVPSAKIFACTSPLKIYQIVNFYYWIFSKQSDSIHDNNYWDDSNIHY